MHVQEQKQIKALTPTGEKNMEETRKHIEETLGVYPSEKAIWNRLKKMTIRRNITDSMWKQLHGTLKILVKNTQPQRKGVLQGVPKPRNSKPHII